MEEQENNRYKITFYLSLLIYEITFILKLGVMPNQLFDEAAFDQQQLMGVKILGITFSILSLVVIILLEYIVIKFIYKKCLKTNSLTLLKKIFFIDYSVKLFVLALTNLGLLISGYEISSLMVSLLLFVLIAGINLKICNPLSNMSSRRIAILLVVFSVIPLL